MDKKAKIATITALVIAMSIAALMVYAAPKKCNNGIDDDNDGLVDYPNDPGCSGMGDNTETGTAICDNGADQSNDRDTLADFRLSGGDPGCTNVTDPSEIDGVCDDLDDETNDRDTLTDSTDPGCVSTSDTNEIDGVCDDFVDSVSDADTLGDASDPGCTSTSDTSEIDGQCDDLSDNDVDTHMDFFNITGDSKCTSFSDNDESPRDSCADTDGGIVSGIQGTVSGDDESVPFSNTDFCLDATTLTEYHCGNKAQDYAPLSTNIDCVGNQTTSCSNGACI